MTSLKRVQTRRRSFETNSRHSLIGSLEPKVLLSGTISGSYFQDLNNNNVKDTGESAIAGRTVWLDTNSNGVIDSTPATLITNSTSMAIPDYASSTPGTVNSYIGFNGRPGVVTDLNIRFSINHTYTGDLTIQLRGPDGTLVTLVNRRGGSGDNFTSTILDDSAATAISAGAAPFSGTFRPDNALSAFNGLNVNGVWQFIVNDNASGDTGVLLSWSMELTTSESIVTDSSGNYAFRNMDNGNYTVNTLATQFFQPTNFNTNGASGTSATDNQFVVALNNFNATNLTMGLVPPPGPVVVNAQNPTAAGSGVIGPNFNGDRNLQFVQLNLTSTQTHRLNVYGVSIDGRPVNVSILNANGDAVYNALATSDSVLDLSFNPPAPGTYFLLFTADIGSMTSTYRYTLSQDEDSESLMANAPDLGMLSSLQPTILYEDRSYGGNPLRTEDFYKFQVSTDTNIQATLSALSVDSNIEILDEAGNTLNTNITAGLTPKTVVAASLIAYKTYYVRISNFVKDYLLTVTQNFSSDDIITNAINMGTLSSSSPVVYATGNIRGSSSDTGSDIQDFYKFRVTNNGTNVAVNLYGMNADADIELLDQFGRYVSSSRLGSTRVEDIAGLNLSSGVDYYLRVYYGTTNYTLTITQDTASNDVLTQAPDLGILSSVNSQITMTAGVDTAQGNAIEYGKFTVAPDSKIEFTFQKFDSNTFQFSILDSEGRRVVTRTPSGAVIGTSVLREGTYYIEVLCTTALQTTYSVTLKHLSNAITDLNLSSATIPENQPAGTGVGTFSSIGGGSGPFNYTLVAGSGSLDNAAFTIVGNQLRSSLPFDFESKSSYSIRVRSTTQDGSMFYEKILVISVSNVAEPAFIDFGQPGYQEPTGAWSTSGALLGNNGTTTRFTNTAAASVRWTPTNLTPGWYRVEFFNVGHSSNSSSVTVTVQSGGGTSTTTFNHATSPVGWRTAGVFYFDGTNTEFLQLSKSGTGYLRADAALFTPVAQPVVTINNEDGQPGYSEQTGTWSTSGLLTGNNGTSTRFSNSSTAAVRWNTTPLLPGWYQVEFFNVAHSTNTTAATLTIQHNGQTTTHTFNQVTTTSGWKTIGKYFFNGTTSDFVQLSKSGSGYLRADAVRFTSATTPTHIVNNEDTQNFFTPNGSWQSSGLAGVQGNSLYSSSANAEARFQFANLLSGLYQIQIFVPASTNSTSQARYTINSNSTSPSVAIDQRAGGWITLGDFNLGSSAMISLTNLSTGLLRADAIRLVPKISFT